MKKQLALATGLATLLIAPAVLPCGAPFGNGIDADPQQDIIVAYKNGVETYVFQPRFCGVASNFGLILPVPSALSQPPTQADQKAFTTVDSLSAPRIVEQTLCSGPPSRAVDAALTGAAGNGGTTVVSTGRVGFLDYALLKADTEQSFTDWLTANGYPYSTTSSSVFSYYVQKNWYFIAFKINQGAVDGGSGTVCNSLGPVQLSFASPSPVVPTRMASASATPKYTSYSNGFSWRVFGITAGNQQLAFVDGVNGNRILNFSGTLAEGDTTFLAGLALPGDRLSKLTLTFFYGSTDPDVGLTLATATDYRETQTVYRYVTCPEAGPLDSPPALADAGREVGFPIIVDASSARETAVATPDAGVVGADAKPSPDTRVLLADAGVAQDAAPTVARNDSGAKSDAAPTELHSGGGCSVSGTTASGEWLALALLGLVLGARVRRRRMP
jgi:MYXO-CTERM domain-containing protein